ncbi:MAG TPA: hypothetical protein VIO94_07890, partial [Phenylobacterium sp.]
MRSSLLAVAAPLALLAACATVPQQSTDAAPAAQPMAAPTAGSTPYGLFLAGQAALADGKSREAADYFDRAGSQGADPEVVRERAFNAALLSGDVKQALSLEPT